MWTHETFPLVQLERKTRQPEPWKKEEGGGDEEGPKRPDVNKPDTQRLLQRMRRVDPDQARRYRQRTGE